MCGKMSNKIIHPPMKYVEKGWGYEKWIINKEEYCGKLLFFEKGKKCSWHLHKLKDEVFYLHSGKVIIRYGEDDNPELANEVLLEPGQNFYVYTGLKHQVIALEDSEILNFQLNTLIATVIES